MFLARIWSACPRFRRTGRAAAQGAHCRAYPVVGDEDVHRTPPAPYRDEQREIDCGDRGRAASLAEALDEYLARKLAARNS